MGGRWRRREGGERERENASTHARREPPRISTSSVGSAAGASLSRALLQAGQSAGSAKLRGTRPCWSAGRVLLLGPQDSRE